MRRTQSPRHAIEGTETDASPLRAATNGSRSNRGGSTRCEDPEPDGVRHVDSNDQNVLENFDSHDTVASGPDILRNLYATFHARASPGSAAPVHSPVLAANLVRRPTEAQDISLRGSVDVPLELLTPGGQDYSTLDEASFDPGLADNHDATLTGGDVDFQLSPDMLTDDGIFLPGSRYQALHNTLRNHVFITARSAQPSREASPGDEGQGNGNSNRPLPPTFRFANSAGAEEISGTNVKLTPHQEYILWNNWVVEISPWVSICCETLGCSVLIQTLHSLTNLTRESTSDTRSRSWRKHVRICATPC